MEVNEGKKKSRRNKLGRKGGQHTLPQLIKWDMKTLLSIPHLLVARVQTGQHCT